jgi:dTMP kinase
VSAPRGRLVVLEGGEGVGKSTQHGRLVARFTREGIPHEALVEPGSTELGQAVRELVLHRTWEIAPAAEALLYMAARAELVARRVRPAIEAGKVVLLDRFFLSTYAYQAAGRGLSTEMVRAANQLAVGGLQPDLTLLMQLPLAQGLARAKQRSGYDRIEASGDAFHDRVAAAFAEFATPAWQRAHPECGPIVVVDAAGTESDVEERLITALGRQWPETFALRAESHP